MLDLAQVLKGVRVMLVEDELDVATLLLFVFKDAGAEVTLLTEAEPALALLQDIQPDILLSDVRLPLHDGNWLIRQIRIHRSQAVRQLPAVAMTSYLRDVRAKNLLDAGFDAFLSKLVEPDELIAALSQAIQHGNN